MGACIVKTSPASFVLRFKHFLDVRVLGRVFEEETEGVGRQVFVTGRVKTSPAMVGILFKHFLDVGVLG